MAEKLGGDFRDLNKCNAFNIEKWEMNAKILVIDREPDIVKNLNTLLTKEGYQVRSAPMSEAVMNIVKSEPFDLLIMDINMPGEDGLKIMRNIKKLDEEIEIIVLTGSVSVNNAIKALRHNGAFDFLPKPMENGYQLVNTIKQTLQKKRQDKEKRELFKKLKQDKEELEHRIEILTAELAKEIK